MSRTLPQVADNKKGESLVIQANLFAKDLIDKTIELNGTLDLAHRMAYSHQQLEELYPQIDNFFEKKRSYDPQEIFTNTFYEKYRNHK